VQEEFTSSKEVPGLGQRLRRTLGRRAAVADRVGGQPQRVERLMREYGIVGLHKPRKIRTTIPGEDNPPIPGLIGGRAPQSATTPSLARC
jgi:hypothetical protein